MLPASPPPLISNLRRRHWQRIPLFRDSGRRLLPSSRLQIRSRFRSTSWERLLTFAIVPDHPTGAALCCRPDSGQLSATARYSQRSRDGHCSHRCWKSARRQHCGSRRSTRVIQRYIGRGRCRGGRVRAIHVRRFRWFSDYRSIQGQMFSPLPVAFGPPYEVLFLILYGPGIRIEWAWRVSASHRGNSVPGDICTGTRIFRGRRPGEHRTASPIAPRQGFGQFVLTVDGKVANTLQVAFQ